MRKRLLLLGAALATMALLTPVVQNSVRRALVVPLLYAVWAAQLLFESVPQPVVWVFALALALLLARGSFAARPGAHARRTALVVPQQGRVAEWTHLVEQSDQDAYAAWRLSQRLGQLAQDVLAHQEGLAHRQVREQLERGGLDMPPAVRAYMRAGIAGYRPHGAAPGAARAALLQRLQRRARAVGPHPSAEQLVQYLETRLSHAPKESL